MKNIREKVNRVINEKNMVCLMNNTKWNELLEGVKTLPFPPAYQIKYVHIETLFPEIFVKDINYWGDWSEVLITPYYCIEWIRIRPTYKKHRGMLIEDEVIDETNEFITLLNQYSIPYENEDDGTYIIYGYKKIG